MESFSIREAVAGDVAAVADLFKDLYQFLNINISFAGFQAELDDFPGKYAPPSGCFLIGWSYDGRPLGCVAYKQLAQGCCEMKRLYVTESARGMRLGQALVEAICQKAKAAGYTTMRLETADRLEAAMRMYKKNGFTEIPPYYNSRLLNSLFMEKQLDA